jgi:predicted nucleotidyltransferase
MDQATHKGEPGRSGSFRFLTSEGGGDDLNRHALVEHLRERVPGLLAVYAFGSRIRGTANERSDLDLAVLVGGYADPLLLWRLADDLAERAGCPVDLLDLRGASTVMQYQIVTTGERWWAADVQAAIYEAAILSEKTELDRGRAGLLEDIGERGTIYGG